MNETALIILAAIALATIVIIFFTNRRSPQADTSLAEWLKSMDKRIDNQASQMIQAQQAIYSKLAESAKSIGEMSEIGKSMKDIQQFLASPKLRGGLGEQGLKELLDQSLPKAAFAMQYGFQNGTKVDAAIKTTSGIIPIDSKFSMENFKKMHKDRVFEKDFISDVKDRVDEIAKKYILTDENTVDFALMYIPSESVYYEIVNNNSDLMAYAYKRRVMPVSPSTFYAFLRSVLLSFEGQKIAAEVKTIQQAIHAIQTETSKFGELLNILQAHVNNSYNMMNKVASQFVGLSSKVESIQKLESEKTPELPK